MHRRVPKGRESATNGDADNRLPTYTCTFRKRGNEIARRAKGGSSRLVSGANEPRRTT